METAESIINDALQEMLVQESEQPIEPVDFQTARRYLNRMMATHPYNRLGYTTVTTPADVVTVPDGAIMGMIKNLAKYLLTTYNRPLTVQLSEDAKEGLKEIRRLTVNILPTKPPCTLPMGSGNERYNYNTSKFYSCPDDELLTEQNGSILLEDATPNV